MFRRNIKERVETIAPFLRLDHNPYLVISEGRLFWMQDAYTTSDYFPYASRLCRRRGAQLHSQLRQGRRRRLQRLCRLVPGGSLRPDRRNLPAHLPWLVQAFAAMPQDLQRHIRYPEDLFLIQAQIYRGLPHGSPEVFYNREDLWQFPRQAGGRRHCHDGSLLHDHAPAGRAAGREHPDAARWCRASART